MDSSLWFDTITWDSPLYISRDVRLYFSTNIILFCLKIVLIFINSVDLDEMQSYVQKHSFMGFQNTKG